MDYRMCGRFDYLIKFFPDELGKIASRDIHSLGNINNYCSNGISRDKNCNTDIDKIKGAFLWLFEQNIINRISSLSTDQPKVFIIYIMIWLSYMLNLKDIKKFKNINEFYEEHIKHNTHYTNNKNCGDDCNSILKDQLGYNNFKEFIEENECLMNIDINDISKFYDAFKLLCEIYDECKGKSPDCAKCSQVANKFVVKYNELNNVFDISESSPYYQVLSTLSTDYDNFKNECSVKCSNSSFPTIEKKKITVNSSEQNSEAIAQSSSIGNKLFIVLSIFAAIPIFLGIVYKVNNKELKNYFHCIYVNFNK
ncbi:putative yir1 protein [Plasmodium yoelii yoelii]|uniref:Yir1 protein n=1 Tax=Plasmodium yoelii yoelii TaxID=73239 RepID=Q7R7Z8_PLAYO|nr:putative yir1 protein [Plasmodium yoelii yoelii]